MLSIHSRFPQILFMLLALSAPADAPLHAGEVFPSLTAQTLSGASLELPKAGAGKAQVVVFSFTRAAGTDARLWNEQLTKDFSATPEFARFSVIVLESVPKLVRGMAASGIKSATPTASWNKTALLYKDEAPWRSRLAVANDSHAYVVLLDGASRVAWISKGPFSEKEYAELKTELARAN